LKKEGSSINMVKISNPIKEEENNETINSNLNMDLTDESFKEMLKPETKKDTTPINFRLETDVVNEIKTYAEENNTTITEVLKDILIGYYNNKKITKGTFNLKEPVNLIIPKSRTLLNEYIQQNVNIISTINETVKGTEINPLDPQLELYNNSSSGYELIKITRANNILDILDTENKCYHFNLTGKYYWNGTETIIAPEEAEDKLLNSIHGGLLLVNIPTDQYKQKLETLIVYTLTIGTKLIKASIITVDTALDLAIETKNNDLMKYINKINEYAFISELVNYDNTNEELSKENEELSKVIVKLLDENEEYKLEIETLNNEVRNGINQIKEDSTVKYVEDLEKEIKKLTKELETMKAKVKDWQTKADNLRELFKEIDFIKQH